MKKPIFIAIFVALVSFSAFCEDTQYFVGSWFWSHGNSVNIDKTDKKVFTADGRFLTYTLRNNFYVLNERLQTKFRVDTAKSTVTFYTSDGEYVYQYHFENSHQTLVFIDLTIRENPVIYCYKFSD